MAFSFPSITLQKEKIFKEREELLSNNQTTLINCIKNVLKINKEIVK